MATMVRTDPEGVMRSFRCPTDLCFSGLTCIGGVLVVPVLLGSSRHTEMVFVSQRTALVVLCIDASCILVLWRLTPRWIDLPNPQGVTVMDEQEKQKMNEGYER